ASAEIYFPVGTASARFDHPILATEHVQRRGIMPNFGERPLAYVVEVQARNHSGRVTRQYCARRRDAQVAVSPSAHTPFRPIGEIVGPPECDFELSTTIRARRTHLLFGASVLLAGRQQQFPVLHRPSVVLSVRELQSIRTETPCEFNELRNASDVPSMQH